MSDLIYLYYSIFQHSAMERVLQFFLTYPRSGFALLALSEYCGYMHCEISR